MSSRMVPLSLLLFGIASTAPLRAAEPAAAPTDPNIRKEVVAAPRILFLGDSITHAGQYIAYVDAWLWTQPDGPRPTIIDAGLPSETVSGLSEEGHAGGAFPRPDLAERLDRVLKVTEPDLVFACYGMNCGIYQKFDEDRFAKYQAGIKNLKQQVEAAGAQIVFVTPPTYDHHQKKGGFSYNDVLHRYSEWLLAQREQGWRVIDLNGPMTAAVLEKQKADPKFTFQPDSVHPNAAGHWFIASVLIRALGDEKGASAESPQQMVKDAGLQPELLELAQQRMSILRDAYVGAAGHKRPGVAAGLSIEEATKKAADLTARMQQLAKPAE